MNQSQEEILLQYRNLAVEWGSLQSEPKRANRVYRRLHAYYKEIRPLGAGRDALRTMLNDPLPVVRFLAATHLLPITPDKAEPVLRSLVELNSVYGFDAKHTLIAFHNGQLNLDW